MELSYSFDDGHAFGPDCESTIKLLNAKEYVLEEATTPTTQSPTTGAPPSAVALPLLYAALAVFGYFNAFLSLHYNISPDHRCDSRLVWTKTKLRVNQDDYNNAYLFGMDIFFYHTTNEGEYAIQITNCLVGMKNEVDSLELSYLFDDGHAFGPECESFIKVLKAEYITPTSTIPTTTTSTPANSTIHTP